MKSKIVLMKSKVVLIKGKVALKKRTPLVSLGVEEMNINIYPRRGLVRTASNFLTHVPIWDG